MKDRSDNPDYARMLAEEELILAATELVAEAMAARGVNRKRLAELLHVSQAEITQRLSGARNLTLRSLAAMLHVLDVKLLLPVVDSDEIRHGAFDGSEVFTPSAQAVPRLTARSGGVPCIPLNAEWQALDSSSLIAEAS